MGQPELLNELERRLTIRVQRAINEVPEVRGRIADAIGLESRVSRPTSTANVYVGYSSSSFRLDDEQSTERIEMHVRSEVLGLKNNRLSKLLSDAIIGHVLYWRPGHPWIGRFEAESRSEIGYSEDASMWVWDAAFGIDFTWNGWPIADWIDLDPCLPPIGTPTVKVGLWRADHPVDDESVANAEFEATIEVDPPQP
jgi:hypothetical protein